MEQLAHLASIAASAAAVLAPPAALGTLIFGPRVGPFRALVLGLRTRLFLRANPVSQRTQDVASLRQNLSIARKDQYIIVAGPKGVGKSCIVETATQKTFGVVNVGVQPGTPMNGILSDVLKAVTGIPILWLNPSYSARRVVWWHHLVFRVPPTVVIVAAERKPSQQFADLDAAARVLAQSYGLRVVIDSSNNSLPEFAKATKREMLVEVPPMPRETLEQLPELKILHAALSAANLADVVWACVGGVPADYRSLDSMWEKRQRNGQELGYVVTQFTEDLLAKAKHNIRGQVAKNKPMHEFYDLFSEAGVTEVPESKLSEMDLERPSPDKVLRLSRRGSDYVLIPADAATALVLRFKRRAPTTEELQAYVQSPVLQK